MESPMYRFVSLAGLLAMLGIAYALSEDRRRISLRVVGWGLGLQLLLVLFVLKTRPGLWLFERVGIVFEGIVSWSDAGAGFLFGNLTKDPSYGAQMAFHVLPIIIFVASLSAVLYHLRVIQVVVRAMARVMQRTMKTSGAESLSAALFVFMGIESVTAVGKYIARMTRSELFVVMTAFLGTIASSVMAIYVTFGAEAGHLLAASLMSAPAAVVIAKIMIPERETPVTGGRVSFEPEVTTVNVFDAAATGAAEGVRLAITIGAMLLAFVAGIAMLNAIMTWARIGTLQEVLGWCFRPFAVLMGVPKGDWSQMGELLGLKTVLNEFLAYQRMQEMIQAGEISARTVTVATYALCGFANFGSMAILIGGLSGVAPERKGDVASLSVKALIGGTLASFMTACYAGMLG